MADTKNPSKPAATTTPAHETRPAISRRDDKIGYEPRPVRPAWRDKLTEGFKTFLWVAPLTALIWIYAERAQIASLEVRVPIAVRSTSPDRLVTVLAPTDRYVTLDIRAPRASLDALRERLSTNVRPIEVTVPDDIPPGFEGDISVTDRIERNPIFQQNAVDVERSFPAVRIKVERKASRELPVRPRPEDSGFANVTFSPPTIKIEGPQSVIDKIAPDQGVYADLDQLRALKPGTREAIVSVLGFDQENVTKSHTKVKATVEIRQGETLTLPFVFIEAIVPVTMMRFERHVVAPIQTQRTLTNVEVIGPPAQIERLRSPKGDFQPRVRVTIDPKDLEQPDGFVKRVTAEDYVLPPGVTVLNPNKDIQFEVKPR